MSLIAWINLVDHVINVATEWLETMLKLPELDFNRLDGILMEVSGRPVYHRQEAEDFTSVDDFWWVSMGFGGRTETSLTHHAFQVTFDPVDVHRVLTTAWNHFSYRTINTNGSVSKEKPWISIPMSQFPIGKAEMCCLNHNFMVEPWFNHHFRCFHPIFPMVFRPKTPLRQWHPGGTWPSIHCLSSLEAGWP